MATDVASMLPPQQQQQQPQQQQQQQSSSSMPPIGAMQTQQMATVYCSNCGVQLSYPVGAMYIQCPRCSNTQNPQAPQQTNCVGCGALLAHPPNALYIQCPKCLTTMNVREQPRFSGRPQVSSSQVRGRKRQRDPDAPAPQKNAYMFFCLYRRATLKEQKPDLQFGALGAELGKLWRELSPQQKKRFEGEARNDKIRYTKEMEEYQEKQRQSMNGYEAPLPVQQQQQHHHQMQSSHDVSNPMAGMMMQQQMPIMQQPPIDMVQFQNLNDLQSMAPMNLGDGSLPSLSGLLPNLNMPPPSIGLSFLQNSMPQQPVQQPPLSEAAPTPLQLPQSDATAPNAGANV